MIDLEKLAVELYESSKILSVSDSGYIYSAKYNFKAMAHHVAVMMIEAKIEILREILAGPDWPTSERIAALEAEKEKLK